MAKRISAMDLRKRLGEVVNEVSLRDDEYIVERGGKPLKKPVRNGVRSCSAWRIYC